MKKAYVDTSYLVAIVLRESAWQHLRTALRPYQAKASELLAAELLAVARREQLPNEEIGVALSGIDWIVPSRSLRPEIDRVLERGYVRGADLWHLACACYLASRTAELAFFSRDQRQRELAAKLGFPTP